MQTEVTIELDQLIELAKQLPVTQWEKLKQEVESQKPEHDEREEFRQLLLQGPVFSKKQLDTMAETRKKINQWRPK